MQDHLKSRESVEEGLLSGVNSWIRDAMTAVREMDSQTYHCLHTPFVIRVTSQTSPALPNTPFFRPSRIDLRLEVEHKVQYHANGEDSVE